MKTFIAISAFAIFISSGSIPFQRVNCGDLMYTQMTAEQKAQSEIDCPVAPVYFGAAIHA